MGARGLSNKQDEYQVSDRFSWIKDVSTERLNKYIARAEILEKQHGRDYDPQNRHIGVVAYYAKDELKARGE